MKPSRRIQAGEKTPLLSLDKDAKGSSGLVVGLLIVLGVLIVAALVIGIIALVRTVHNPLDEHVDHGPARDVGDQWLYRGRDLTNSANSPRTQINSANVHTLVESFKGQIGQDPSLGGTIPGAFRADVNWGSTTVDDQYIFLATQNQRNEAGVIINTTGYIMAFNRQTGQRVWNRAVTSYSLDNGPEQYGADFEAAPAIHGDLIYIGTKNQRPQTYASTPYQTITNPRFYGFPAIGKARPTHVYALNRHTGEEVWAREIGEVATHFGSPDNLLQIAMSPIVFELDPTGGNNPIPVVAIGTTSGNSFVPDYSGSSETDAKGYAIPSGGQNGLGTDPLTRMTDVGRMVLINGITGQIISTTMMGPPLYKEGDTLKADSVVYGISGAYYDMEIWHLVQAADLAWSGELNPIIDRYRVSKMIISILPNATIVAGSPLVGLAVHDNTGANHVIAAGVAPSNLDFVTVSMEVEFLPGTTNFLRLFPQPSPVLFDTTTSDLDGAAGNVPARIVKQLKINDTLTDQDAYECNYYGASVWGSSPSIIFNRDGIATELIIATGQAHKIPYDQTKRFSKPKPPQAYATPIERLFHVEQQEKNFEANPNNITLQAIRDANADRLHDILLAREERISPRGKEFLFDSVISINLRPGHIGEVIWSRKSVGYDTWRIGLLDDQQRQDEEGNKVGFSDAEWHHGMLRGHDGDYSECPYYCPNCGEHGGDYIVAPSKGGSVLTLKISDVNDGPTYIISEKLSLLGNPGILGGSEYGSMMDIERRVLYTTQSNEAAAFRSTIDRPFNKRSLAPVMSWYPVNEHDAATIQPFTHRQTYLSGYDFLQDKIIFEVALQTEPPYNTYASPTAFSGGADLIFIQPNNLTMQFRRKSDGELVHSLTLDSAGISNFAVLDRELIIANGRQNFKGDNPAGTNYNGVKYVYKFSLP